MKHLFRPLLYLLDSLFIPFGGFTGMFFMSCLVLSSISYVMPSDESTFP